MFFSPSEEKNDINQTKRGILQQRMKFINADKNQDGVLNEEELSRLLLPHYFPEMKGVFLKSLFIGESFVLN